MRRAEVRSLPGVPALPVTEPAGAASAPRRRARPGPGRVGLAAGCLLLALALLALAAPVVSQLVTHQGPLDGNVDARYQPPGPAHWLGTDELGRDMLTRLVWGARASLGVGFLAVALQICLGAATGLTAAIRGGWVDEVLCRVIDVLLAIPPIFLFILLASMLRPNAVLLAIIIASLGWCHVARIVRGDAVAVSARDFVLATRSLGASEWRLVVRHVLPNVLPVIVVVAGLGIGQVILIEASLDFLGLGVQPPDPTWGNMLTSAQSYFYHSAWLVLFPGLTLLATVLAANLFGNAVRDALDPRIEFR